MIWTPNSGSWLRSSKLIRLLTCYSNKKIHPVKIMIVLKKKIYYPGKLSNEILIQIFYYIYNYFYQILISYYYKYSY